jgi:O-antigen ligase
VADSLERAELLVNPVVVAIGALLFLMLVFGTCTVFVREAWALQSFQIGVYAVLAVYLLISIWRRSESFSEGWLSWLVYLMPLWGVGQILAHTTSSSFETRQAVLRWGALAGVFFLSQAVTRSGVARKYFLNAFLWFASCMAVLCLTQIFTSQGRVLWMFPTGYSDVYATFQNQNNYVQFVELALPIALWKAIREGWPAWWYPLAGGVLYASAIGSASRAGAVLCTAELLAMLGVGLVRPRRSKGRRFSRSAIAALVAVPIFAAVFTFAVGWQRLTERFRTIDPDLTRGAFLMAAVDMAEHRPLTGFGLGTFPSVYQRYAVRDFPFYANHAHNDWAEFAADGGIPFLLLALIPFAAAIPSAVRHAWALGLIAVMLHACVDYPFPRPAVSGWMYALLGVLYMEQSSDSSTGITEAETKVGM